MWPLYFANPSSALYLAPLGEQFAASPSQQQRSGTCMTTVQRLRSLPVLRPTSSALSPTRTSLTAAASTNNDAYIHMPPHPAPSLAPCCVLNTAALSALSASAPDLTLTLLHRPLPQQLSRLLLIPLSDHNAHPTPTSASISTSLPSVICGSNTAANMPVGSPPLSKRADSRRPGEKLPGLLAEAAFIIGLLVLVLVVNAFMGEEAGRGENR